jgi:hypothetical protein
MNMKRESFSPLEGVEYATAIAALSNGGYASAEFLLEECRSDVQLPGGNVGIYKLVRVKRVSTGFQHQYNCGPGGGWPFEFERDLGLHVFGEVDASCLA